MVAVETLVRLVGGFGLLLANGFFVTTEFAMTRVRQFSPHEFRDGAGLERAWEMTERLEIYLSGCQLGITISSVGLGVVAEPAVSALVQPLLSAVGIAASDGHAAVSVLVSLAIVNLAHVVVGEQAPTYFGVERTKTAARYGAPMLYYWTRVTYPAIVVADWVAKRLLGLFGVEMTRSWAEEGEADGDVETLRAEMGQILTEGGIDRERREEVMNALDIGTRPVEDVMVPREDIVALSTERSFEENVQLMREEPHGRFPLVGDELETYYGVVYTPDVLRHFDDLRDGDASLAERTSEPLVVPRSLSVASVVDRLQDAGEELALVVDDEDGPREASEEDGGARRVAPVVGLVTQTDALETITGQLHDPLDSVQSTA